MKFKKAQLLIAVALASFGMALIVASFWVPPTGIIDSSVLVAIGEVFTFSGSLFGIDYHYSVKAPKPPKGKAPQPPKGKAPKPPKGESFNSEEQSEG